MNKFSLGVITTCVTLLTGSFFIHPKEPYSSFIYTTVYAYEPRGTLVYQLEQSSDQTEPIRTSLSTPLNTPLSASLDSKSNHHNASQNTSHLEVSSNATEQQVPANNHTNTTYESVTSTKETENVSPESTVGYFSVAGELFPLLQMGDPTLYGGQLMEANEYVYDFNGGGYHHLGVERMTRQGSLMLEAKVGDTVFYNGDAYMIYHIDYNVSNTGSDLSNLAYQYHQEGAITASTCESTAWMSPQRLFYLIPL